MSFIKKTLPWLMGFVLFYFYVNTVTQRDDSEQVFYVALV